MRVLTAVFLFIAFLSVSLTAQEAGQTFTLSPIVSKDSSYYAMSKTEILNITNNIRKMEAKLKLYDTLTTQYKLQIATYESIIQKDTQVINRYESQIQLYQQNDSLYKETIEALQPRWYQNVWIYFGVGIALGFLIGK